MERAIYLDLDGTLLRSDLRISQRSRAALAEAERVATIILSSGRPVQSCVQLSRELLKFPRYVIGSNGGAIYDLANDSVMQSERFPSEVVSELVRFGDRFGASVCLYHALEWFARSTSQSAILEVKRSKSTPTWVKDFDVLYHDVVKALFVAKPNTVAAMLEAIGRHPAMLNYYVSYPEYLEVMPEWSSKGKAVRYLNDRIPFKWSMGLGDGPGDLTLFEAVDCSVAVANGDAGVLRAADYVAPSNDDDGVAIAIEGLLLGDGASSRLITPRGHWSI